jgi:hypothetical protein
MPFYKNKDYMKLIRPLPQYVERDDYDIPFIETQHIDITGLNNEKWLISMKNAKATDTNAAKKIVHSFCYDDVLNRAYNNPIKFLHRVAKYHAVASFDFSMHDEMDFRQILGATYDNRWIGAFLQTNGKRVIPTVGWVNKEYDDICFAGLRNGGTFMIATIGVKNIMCSQCFLRGYFEMRQRFPDSRIICVGDKINGMDSDVLFVPYDESFGNWEQYPGFWQTRLFNADGTTYLRGEE